MINTRLLLKEGDQYKFKQKYIMQKGEYPTCIYGCSTTLLLVQVTQRLDLVSLTNEVPLVQSMHMVGVHCGSTRHLDIAKEFFVPWSYPPYLPYNHTSST